MDCRLAQSLIHQAVESRLPHPESQQLEKHLENCVACVTRLTQLRSLRANLQRLPRYAVPDMLTWRLRVLASKHCQQHSHRHTPHWIATTIKRLQLALDGWQPAVLSMAAGLLAAFVLFTLWAPMYAITESRPVDDVPLIIHTKASLKSSWSTTLPGQEIIVDVLVDHEGRMLDYWVPPGQNWHSDPKLRRSVENTLLCTQFQPATHFGRPALSVLRISLHKNQVDVRG